MARSKKTKQERQQRSKSSTVDRNIIPLFSDEMKQVLPFIVNLLNPISFCNLKSTCKKMKTVLDTIKYKVSLKSNIKETHTFTNYTILGAQYEGKYEIQSIEVDKMGLPCYARIERFLGFYRKGLLEGPYYIWSSEHYIKSLNDACILEIKDEDLVISYHYVNGYAYGRCNRKVLNDDKRSMRIESLHYHGGDITDDSHVSKEIKSQKCKDEIHTGCDLVRQRRIHK